MEDRRVIEKFLHKEKDKIDFLESTGDRLISYGTCIAEWIDPPYSCVIDMGDTQLNRTYVIVINSTRYGVMSESHICSLFDLKQGIVGSEEWLRVSNIPKGTRHLITEKRKDETWK